MQKLLEEIIVNTVQAREAKLKILRIEMDEVKPNVTADEIRKILRTLREYGYTVKQTKTTLKVYLTD